MNTPHTNPSKLESVKQQLLSGRTITPWDAISEARYTRLPDAVYRLKALGWDIQTDYRTTVDPETGHKDRYAAYYLPADRLKEHQAAFSY
ncbi:helix-turn-helix domain-containing protein [Methylococcus mesophilus]|uniref:helix-turn-helix domain-containing protein n=1 Tax=Methylococcus mesophilus TaxID=2993564 RepID=UPI00224B3B6F|nr:helix-turn-helix domain-containing protein [Methylococcus mesophilus]UZR30636.1 hypothetical protein OOT43_08390 [Methylococcus mesophilus]